MNAREVLQGAALTAVFVLLAVLLSVGMGAA